LGHEIELIGLLDAQGLVAGEFADVILPIFDDKTFELHAVPSGVSLAVVAAPGVPVLCDVNGDGSCDVSDVDAMTQNVLTGERTAEERTALIQLRMPQGFETYFGDSNLDGNFNSNDLVTVFTAGQYEDAIDDNSGWAQGDWDGDLDFTSSDLIAAFTDGGYERGPRADVNAVPEPSGFVLLTLALLGIANMRRITDA
jgi:hypothetical protein